MAYPVWITTSGSLGIIPENNFYQFQFDAYNPGGGTLIFLHISGQLPPGVSLTKTGMLQGVPVVVGATNPVNRTYEFSIRAKNPTNQIAAKEFVSVQPMNLPSGLVFYLDFKYGTNVNPFKVGDSLYSANPNTNVTDYVNTSSLYESGRFGYSINNLTASVTFATSSVSLSDINFDTTYTTSSLTKVIVSGSGYSAITASWDTNAIRSFVVSGSGVTPQGIAQQFTKISGNTLVFITSDTPLVVSFLTTLRPLAALE